MIKRLLVALLILFPFCVSASCDYRDRSYPDGTKIGGQVCDENGRWIDEKEWLSKNTESEENT